MARIKPKWERGQMSSDSENKVFCTAPWTHTYISPQSERRMCCASREEHMMQRQYIDASNDKSTGKYKDVGTIEVSKFRRTLELSIHDGHKKETYGR